MLKQMKKTLCILLAVLFVVSLTAVAVSSNPVMVKKQNMDMNKMDMKKKYMNKMDTDCETEQDMHMNKMGMNKKGMAIETDED
jgi:hypothetical protein